MISKNRIGFFLPSLGFDNPEECLQFVEEHGGLVQGWTILSKLAHEEKNGIPFDFFKDGVESKRLKVSSLSGYMDWTEESENFIRKEEFKRIIDQCSECKTNIICTETGRAFTDREDKKAWNLLIESMKELCVYAKKGKIQIAIEMGRSDLVFGVPAFRKLQDAVGSNLLKINFDPANLIRGNLNPAEVLNELKDEVVQFHLKDADKNGMTPLTKGDVDFLALIDIMENHGYSGNYIIEQEYENYDNKTAVSKDYINAISLLS